MDLSQKEFNVYLVFNVIFDKKMRRYIWFLVLLLLLLFIPSTIFLFFIMKPEHFQTENNICVTVKGSFNGCYFIPYKYNSILPPKTDYIKAKSGHAGGLTVDFLSPTNVVLRFDNVDMWKVNMSNIKYVIDSNDYYSHVESLYPVVRYIFPFDTYIHPSIAERKNDSTYIFFHL